MFVQHIVGFSPSEAAEQTGIGVVLQRDHRRRFPQWLPQRSGHARFNLFQILQMRFVADAGEFGLGPGEAYPIGEWVAHSALQFALLERGALEGDLRGECSIPDATDDEVASYTARRVSVEAFGCPHIGPSSYAAVWADGSNYFTPTLDEFELFLDALEDNDPRSGKPFIALHLPTFARRVVSNLPRPAVRILRAEPRD